MEISLFPALTTPIISADSGCAISNNDQIHQFCNALKSTGHRKIFKSKTYTCSRLGPSINMGHVPWLYGKWNYEQCFPARSEGRKKSYANQRVDIIYIRGKFWLSLANRPHFSWLTHGRSNPSMTTCIHYHIAKKISDPRKLQV
jgi:hypothetical protein